MKVFGRKNLFNYVFAFLVTGTLISVFFQSCKNEKKEKKENVTVKKYSRVSPEFNADSCYVFVEKQLAFGPRVPGSKAHKSCGDFILNTCKRFNLTCIVQNAEVSTYNNKKFNLYNIIASYKPEKEKRILLLAHWDTRHIAENDTKDTDKPIMGADDGASGVAVMLEIARLLNVHNPEIGIDFFFTDLEDYGAPSESESSMKDSWCLGTQHWAKNPHIPGYKAEYGILFDMVGAKEAVFPKEGTSLRYAQGIVDKVWQNAYNLGYGNLFIEARMGQTTDDHLYVNTIANIPCIDIVYMNPATGSYGDHHHTHQDDISIIDKNILKAVGQTALETIWQ